GQVSLGSGGVMGVGGHGGFNLCLRVPGVKPGAAILLLGLFSRPVGALGGIPSLRHKGFYPAGAAPAAPVFSVWVLARVKWFTNYIPSGSLTAPQLTLFGHTIESPQQKYLLCLAIVTVFALLAKNLVRSRIGRSWMAMRDMDVAAEIIGIRPLTAKL